MGFSTGKKLLVTKRNMRSGSGALSTWGTNLRLQEMAMARLSNCERFLHNLDFPWCRKGYPKVHKRLTFAKYGKGPFDIRIKHGFKQSTQSGRIHVDWRFSCIYVHQVPMELLTKGPYVPEALTRHLAT